MHAFKVVRVLVAPQPNKSWACWSVIKKRQQENIWNLDSPTIGLVRYTCFPVALCFVQNGWILVSLMVSTPSKNRKSHVRSSITGIQGVCFRWLVSCLVSWGNIIHCNRQLSMISGLHPHVWWSSAYKYTCFLQGGAPKKTTWLLNRVNHRYAEHKIYT